MSYENQMKCNEMTEHLICGQSLPPILLQIHQLRLFIVIHFSPTFHSILFKFQILTFISNF